METFKLTRDIPVIDGYDVLVAGGGPAGSAAADSRGAARRRVLMVEASGCLGGMGTAGLVTNFGPMSDGERPLVGGFTRELIETLYARDMLGPDVTPSYWMSDYNRKIQFKPEGLKRLLDESASMRASTSCSSRVVDGMSKAPRARAPTSPMSKA